MREEREMTLLDRFILIYMGVISLISAVITVYDKIAAKIWPRHRIRERTLLLFSAFGGAPVMLTVMAIIRHKTQHFGMITFISVFTLLWLTAAIAYLLFLR